MQSLQTGDRLPMPSLRSSRPTGHDPYRNVRQSDSQIQHSQLDNWAADLRHRPLPRSGLVHRQVMEYRPVERLHSGLILAARITLPHFSVSSAISFSKSAGESASTAPPRSASRALILGSARPALISLFSFSTISAGVAFGAPTPYQKLASYPGTNSAKVGMSGSASARIAVVTASARSLPVLMCSIEEGTEPNATCTCPPSKSVSAGASPRY